MPAWLSRAIPVRAARTDHLSLSGAAAVAMEGREEIIENAALAGLDFGGHGHTGQQIEPLAVDVEVGLIERDTGREMS